MVHGRHANRTAGASVRAAALAALVASGLGGCSSYPDALNPFEWYRGLTGADKKDDLDKTARNSQNLEAGGNAPYPNVGTVPAEPDTAMSTAERKREQDTLAADRRNALYADEQLRQGRPVPPLPGNPPAGSDTGVTSRPPPDPAAPVAAREPPVSTPAKGSAQAPQEASLTTPAVRSVPQGEQPLASPPAPAGTPGATKLPRQQATVRPSATLDGAAPQRQAALSPDVAPAAPVMRGRRSGVTVEAAVIDFAGDGRTLSRSDDARLVEVVRLYREIGGTLRVVGHGGSAGDIAGFDHALDRANAVAQALARLGVPARRITVQTADDLGGGGAEVLMDY